MPSRKRHDPAWREFELLVSRLEADAGPAGLTVKSPDRIRSKVTGRLREVDGSIRYRIGSVEVLITLECRRRTRIQDVTWIEQLASKRMAVGADRTVAISASGFTEDARVMAEANGISLRKLSDLSIVDVNSLLRLDFVLFWHKVSALARIGVREFRSLDWTVPDPEDVDVWLPKDTDPFAAIFHSEKTGESWCLNDLWLELQEATDPFDGVEKAQPPVLRTACFPYPGTVTVTANGEDYVVGDVLLTIALWIESEQVSLDAATRVEYAIDDSTAFQRVEFAARRRDGHARRVSLQIPKNLKDMADLRKGGDWGQDEGL